jgi:hypothetical protein
LVVGNLLRCKPRQPLIWHCTYHCPYRAVPIDRMLPAHTACRWCSGNLSYSLLLVSLTVDKVGTYSLVVGNLLSCKPQVTLFNLHGTAPTKRLTHTCSAIDRIPAHTTAWSLVQGIYPILLVIIALQAHAHPNLHGIAPTFCSHRAVIRSHTCTYEATY